MAASAPSSLVSHAHFASLPAVPITRHPRILPICTTSEPVAPAAPETTSVSPAFGLPISLRPYQPVNPGTPSTPRNADGGASFGSRARRPSPFDTKCSRQPRLLTTSAPVGKLVLREVITSPTARPSAGWPTCHGWA